MSRNRASLPAAVGGRLARLLLAFLLASGPAFAGLPKAANVPGGIALVPVAPRAPDVGDPPRVWFGDQRLLVLADRGQWIAVVGLALETLPGHYTLRVEDGDAATQATFTVTAKTYPEQRITLKDRSQVDLSANDLARVEREIAEIRRLKHHWRESRGTDTDFVIPAQGKLSGRFGLRRVFNGEPRSPHAGFDIAAPRGSSVVANANGVVLAIGDYFFNGRTVVVDHGNGLLSMYCHLDAIEVAAGETVDKGQRLGASGMSGRATGPHLHWSVILNGSMVDPELFLGRPKSAR